MKPLERITPTERQEAKSKGHFEVVYLKRNGKLVEHLICDGFLVVPASHVREKLLRSYGLWKRRSNKSDE